MDEIISSELWLGWPKHTRGHCGENVRAGVILAKYKPFCGIQLFEEVLVLLHASLSDSDATFANR